MAKSGFWKLINANLMKIENTVRNRLIIVIAPTLHCWATHIHSWAKLEWMDKLPQLFFLMHLKVNIIPILIVEFSPQP